MTESLPATLTSVTLDGFGPKMSGKVRDIYVADGKRILITTDRVSAFDRVLGAIPCKGQVLNQLSAWWFEELSDIIPNHVIEVPDPNVTVAVDATPLPVEVIVRGYITGVTSTSLWTLYAKGDRRPYGIELPDGLKKNDALPNAIITPTTKAEQGAHDERITRDEIVDQGLVDRKMWEQVEKAALAIFARGQAVARAAGLILVDSKYEFGIADGKLVLIDEVHTPDSSRYWILDSYGPGREPANFDKEFLREWFVAKGYRGEGEAPALTPEFAAEVADRYIRAYELLTGRQFKPGAQPAEQRIVEAMNRMGKPLIAS